MLLRYSAGLWKRARFGVVSDVVTPASLANGFLTRLLPSHRLLFFTGRFIGGPPFVLCRFESVSAGNEFRFWLGEIQSTPACRVWPRWGRIGFRTFRFFLKSILVFVLFFSFFAEDESKINALDSWSTSASRLPDIGIHEHEHDQEHDHEFHVAGRFVPGFT